MSVDREGGNGELSGSRGCLREWRVKSTCLRERPESIGCIWLGEVLLQF